MHQQPAAQRIKVSHAVILECAAVHSQSGWDSTAFDGLDSELGAGRGGQFGAGAGLGGLPGMGRGLAGRGGLDRERAGRGRFRGAAALAEEHPFGGPMGMGQGGKGEDDSEHRRRFPVEENDLFTLDQKASPPVIGL